jgi:hypothetical protein
MNIRKLMGISNNQRCVAYEMALELASLSVASWTRP